MTAEQAFEELLRAVKAAVGGGNAGTRVHVGMVKEVNEKEGTCVVEREDMPELHDVRLNAVIDEGVTDRVMVVPAVGSYVLVLLMGDATEGMVVATSTVEKVVVKTGGVSWKVSADGIEMNGGKLGGMIDIAKLTDSVNALVEVFNNHTHQVSTTGSASAQSGTAAAIIGKAGKLKRGDYEDERVKH